MNIEIKKPNRIKEFFQNVHSKLEDLMFDIIQRLPDAMMPDCFMEWLDRYTTKRLDQLKQENIRLTWENMYLEDAVKEISKR